MSTQSIKSLRKQRAMPDCCINCSYLDYENFICGNEKNYTTENNENFWIDEFTEPQEWDSICDNHDREKGTE